MHPREQYLARVREEYPAAIRQKKRRGPRQRAYTREVQTALTNVWEPFDYPHGQRLAPALRNEVARLRRARELGTRRCR